jgi:tetrahydromethanopterin S-methyltransferase subunit E
MVQKYLAMVAILGAIAAIGSIGMVTTQAKAFERTCHYWSNGDSQCEWGPYFAYTQQPTIHTVSCEPCGNAPGPGWACNTC